MGKRSESLACLRCVWSRFYHSIYITVCGVWKMVLVYLLTWGVLVFKKIRRRISCSSVKKKKKKGGLKKDNLLFLVPGELKIREELTWFRKLLSQDVNDETSSFSLFHVFLFCIMIASSQGSYLNLDSELIWLLLITIKSKPWDEDLVIWSFLFSSLSLGMGDSSYNYIFTHIYLDVIFNIAFSVLSSITSAIQLVVSLVIYINVWS
jgi:hypothetical protein